MASDHAGEPADSEGLRASDTSQGDAVAEIEAVAQEMLARLAAEQTPAVPDASRVPGGRWGLATLIGAGVCLVLVAISTIAGLILNR